MIALSPSFLHSYRIFQSCLLVSGSRPVVGSSRKTTLGFETRLIPIESLLLIPSGKALISTFLSDTKWTSFNTQFTICSSSDGETPLILEQNSKCSSTVIISHKISNYGQTPIYSCTISSYFLMLKPPIQALPFVVGQRPVSCDIKVVFPAPFGPSNPKSSPDFTFIQMFLFATLGALPLIPG